MLSQLCLSSATSSLSLTPCGLLSEAWSESRSCQTPGRHSWWPRRHQWCFLTAPLPAKPVEENQLRVINRSPLGSTNGLNVLVCLSAPQRAMDIIVCACTCLMCTLHEAASPQLYADGDLALFESFFEHGVKLFLAYWHRPERNPQGNLINKQVRIIQGLNT